MATLAQAQDLGAIRVGQDALVARSICAGLDRLGQVGRVVHEGRGVSRPEHAYQTYQNGGDYGE